MQEYKYLTEVIAHRGFSGKYPENTLAAFRAAVECGAHRVEFDVLLTRDQVPVVLHDAELDRTSTGQGPVRERSLEELRTLDAGSWFHPCFAGERIPTLDEALAWLGPRIAVNVEIKEEAVVRQQARDDGIEARVVAALKRHGLVATATVSSFEPLAVERVHRLCPQIQCELLYQDADRPPGEVDLDGVVKAGFGGLNVSRDELWANPGLVASARSRGIGIKVYTVDDPREQARLLELGVAGVFTNRPDVMLLHYAPHAHQ